MNNTNRISSLYPNRFNIVNDEQIPIPIESIFFLEEAVRDRDRPNRFYFNFPTSWLTSNKGESIIGVRNIYINARRRRIDFELYVRKYFRKDFDKLLKENPDKTNDEIYEMIDEHRKSLISFNVVSWMNVEDDLRTIFKDIRDEMSDAFNSFNNYYKIKDKAIYDKINKEIDESTNKQTELIGQLQQETDPAKKAEIRKQIEQSHKDLEKKISELNSMLRPLFQQEDDGIKKRDIQFDGYYDYEKKTFIEIIYSPTNDEKTESSQEYVFHKDRYDYYVDFKIDFKERPIINNQQDNSQNSLYDFVDVFNIGRENFQNNPDDYKNKWFREIKFYNVWDRHSCKVFSSFATDNSKGYLGNSQILYHTIKYYKLNSSDQQFWVEFYCARHNNIPTILPINESFNMELQFLPFNKMLYV